MPRLHASTDSDRFGREVAQFLTTLRLDLTLPDGFHVLDPYRSAEVRDIVEAFCREYYAGDNKRIPIWGINPGRFGAGVTGLSFTDPYALTELLHVPSTLTGRRELSAEFISMVITAYGGPHRFYQDFFLSALSPLGFEKDGKNINFYDDATLAQEIRPVILRWLEQQHAFGVRADRCVVLGTGKLKDYMDAQLRPELAYSTVEYLEHPRFIMQYRRKQVPDFVEKYVNVLLRLKG